MVNTLILRDQLIDQVRQFLRSQQFVEVQTPILAGMAGGAVARPFLTSATEFAKRKISLRIAPELWLKRLIVGGMSRIYEIGPSFRNEGLDKTHNPEFTTCEFYATYHTLPMLIALTEDMFCQIHERLTAWRSTSFTSINLAPLLLPRTFKKIDFIPALNSHLGIDLPTLELAHQNEVLEILESKQIPLPSDPSLPNMLDKLSSHYLEPQCTEPTWITNIPECMSPLSKSFEHPTAPNKQRVAARAELFIQGKEVVNCYEEENDPFAQRRKFIAQHTYAVNLAGQGKVGQVDVQDVEVDDDYLRALEWGLPPTGGWGCGIDRLVMLFAGKERISDVLSFGNLRAVTRNAERRSTAERTSLSESGPVDEVGREGRRGKET
jgi:lysyl-tRNA synthetase class 2